LHQVGTSSLLIYMMHGHTYIKYIQSVIFSEQGSSYEARLMLFWGVW